MGWLTVVPNAHSLVELNDPDQDPHDHVVASMEAARLHRLLARLPQLERRVLRRRYGLGCEQLTLRQIASRLGVPVGDARRLERQALEHLRAEYGLKEAA
jgi:RNA polymerase sigma factor (sigma-70 family)